MDGGALLASWEAEERAPFRGWDFSHIEGRLIEEEPPWSYEDLARDAMRGRASLLDLGTGGGEVLSRLRDAFPPRVVATEAYAPNVAVARGRLGVSVDVVPYVADEASAPLPFGDESFEIVLSRHEAYDAREVARVLAPGGVFLTQQVDGRSLDDLLALFGARPQYPTVTVERLSGELEQVGLVVDDRREWWGSLTVRDVGALAYFLTNVPWQLPDFSVSRYAQELLALHRRIAKDRPLAFRIGRFLISARRTR